MLNRCSPDVRGCFASFWHRGRQPLFLRSSEWRATNRDRTCDSADPTRWFLTKCGRITATILRRSWTRSASCLKAHLRGILFFIFNKSCNQRGDRRSPAPPVSSRTCSPASIPRLRPSGRPLIDRGLDPPCHLPHSDFHPWVTRQKVDDHRQPNQNLLRIRRLRLPTDYQQSDRVSALMAERRPWELRSAPQSLPLFRALEVHARSVSLRHG